MGTFSVKNVKKSIFFTLYLLFVFGCASTLIKDTYYYDFYEKVRPLMTDEELERYKHLQDADAKERFITEFWAIRDPDPLTEDNEFRQEFDARLAYAEENFGSRVESQTIEPPRAWNTERGRIYLVLGPPDQRRAFWREKKLPGKPVRDEATQSRSERTWSLEEEWYYADHDMTLVFKSTMGRWHLETDDSGLNSILETAKLGLIARERVRHARGRLRFELEFDGSSLRILIPTDRINYAERIGTVRARIEVSVVVFCGGVRVDAVSKIKEIRLTTAELDEMDVLVIAAAYTLVESGEYVFDVTARDALAVSPLPYRKTLRWKN